MIEILAAVAFMAPPPVTCHRELEVRNAAGLYRWHGEIQLLKPHCHQLRKIHYGRPQPVESAAFATYLLGHELAHHQGIIDEGEATCAGLAWVKKIARALGYPKPYKLRRAAVRLVHTVWYFKGSPYRCERLWLK